MGLNYTIQYNTIQYNTVLYSRTVEVEPHTVLLEEGGVKLSLTVVDTPGISAVTPSVILLYVC